MVKRKILFIHASNASFVLNDMKILKKLGFDVRVLDLTPYQGSTRKKLLYAVKILLSMIKGVIWSDLTFSWFADIHAFLAVLFSKIFKRRCLVVIGGYEVVKAPEINYGGMLSFWKRAIVIFILRYADKILAVSEHSKKETLRWVSRKDIEVVYHGIDCEKFTFSENDVKEDVVITVGRIDKTTLKRKGIETFVRCAKYLVNIPFVVVGGYSDDSIEYLKSIASPNVVFTGYLEQEQLIKLYKRAKVYAQLSYHEGFGVSLAEAMACGCVPVVTNRAALPEVVGNLGFYVPYNDEMATVEAFKKALSTSKEVSEKAMRRIRELFSIEKRERTLLRVIQEVMKNDSSVALQVS
jgi:glycosyltransferase involved in cell wall biosynthesis